jgi:hypothetical protein
MKSTLIMQFVSSILLALDRGTTVWIFFGVVMLGNPATIAGPHSATSCKVRNVIVKKILYRNPKLALTRPHLFQSLPNRSGVRISLKRTLFHLVSLSGWLRDRSTHLDDLCGENESFWSMSSYNSTFLTRIGRISEQIGVTERQQAKN